MPLHPIGTLLPANANGELPRLGGPPHASWTPVLNDVIDQFRKATLGTELSIALRGSAARGVAIDDAADLDLVVLIDDPVFSLDEIVSASAPGLSIETSYIPRRKLIDGSKLAWMRFTLAHSGYTIFGDDLLSALPEPRLGPHCIAHLRNADKWLQKWKSYWDEDKDHQAICQWLMKRIIRSLFESQMMRINAYSRDIYPCAKVATEAFPDLSDAIWAAATFAVSPVADGEAVDRIAAELTPLLLSKQGELKGTSH
jgi:Nucleotidyltransferase domain